MPVVVIRSMRPPDEARVDQMLADVVTGLAGALHASADDVWAYWEEVHVCRIGARRATFAGHCPVVTVRARTGRAASQIRAGLEAVARAISTSLGVPLDDVWVHWLELPEGRVFAGGRVV